MNSQKQIGVIIEARTQSTRYKNKILKKIGNNTVLEFLIIRLKKKISLPIYIATTLNPKDQKIIEICKKHHVNFFRGKEHDLINRVCKCAKKFNLKHIISLTSDNPLVDPSMIKKMLAIYLKNKLDYFDNLDTDFLPRGIAIRIVKLSSLTKFSRHVKKTNNYNYRQHTIIFFIKNRKKKKFKTLDFKIYKNYTLPNYSFTIDYKKDFKKIEKILKYFKYKADTKLLDIIKYIKKNMRQQINE